jgi:hypothetical protein
MSKSIKVLLSGLALAGMNIAAQPALATHVDECTAIAESNCADPAVLANYPYYTACVIAQMGDCPPSAGGGIGGTGENPLPPGPGAPICVGQGPSGGPGCPE